MIETAVRSHQNATNPLKSEPFCTPTFPPLTSTRHTQHVIVRLFANISITDEKPYFVGFRQLFYLISFQLFIRLFYKFQLAFISFVLVYRIDPFKSPLECFDLIEYVISKLSTNGFKSKAGPNHFFSFALSDLI